jgi:hypothetical protein
MDWSSDNRYLTVVVRDYATKKCQLWSFPVAGGQAIRRPLAIDVAGLSLSPDGKLAATLRRESRQQVWAVENFLPR